MRLIAGNQTDCCIDATARGAFSLGYDVTLARDAHRTWGSATQSARQIIDHYNAVLGNGIVTLKEANEIQFV